MRIEQLTVAKECRACWKDDWSFTYTRDVVRIESETVGITTSSWLGLFCTVIMGPLQSQHCLAFFLVTTKIINYLCETGNTSGRGDRYLDVDTAHCLIGN